MVWVRADKDMREGYVFPDFANKPMPDITTTLLPYNFGGEMVRSRARMHMCDVYRSTEPALELSLLSRR